MSSNNNPSSTLNFHVQAKQRELRGALDREAEAAGKLKDELDRHGHSSTRAGEDLAVDALFVQLALLDLPTAAATELLPPDDLKTRGILDDALKGLKIAGERLFRAYSDALHTFICKKAGEDLRQQVLSAISTGTGVSVIAAAFVSIGASTAVASVAAALLLAIIVRPTISEVCKMWAESLAEKAA